MCCLFTCCAWVVDAIQRAWVFAMSCCVCTAICTMMIIASVSGVALGYNYSLAEFVELKETNISVFLKRGVFDDTVVDEMDWRRGGGGPPAAERSQPATAENSRPPSSADEFNPQRRQMSDDAANVYNYPGESAFDSATIEPPNLLSSYDDARHVYEGSLLKLTGQGLDVYKSPQVFEHTNTIDFRRLMQNIDSGNSATNFNPPVPILMTLTIGPGLATKNGRTIVLSENGAIDLETNNEQQIKTKLGSDDSMNEEEMKVIHKLLNQKRQEALKQAEVARTSRIPTTKVLVNFQRTTFDVVPYGVVARRGGGGALDASEILNNSPEMRELLNPEPPKWYTNNPKPTVAPKPRPPLVPPTVYHAEVTKSIPSVKGVLLQPHLSQEEFRRAMLQSFSNVNDINNPARTANYDSPLESTPGVQDDPSPPMPMRTGMRLSPQRTKSIPKFVQADNDVDAIMKSEQEYYEEEDISGRPARKRRRKSAKT